MLSNFESGFCFGMQICLRLVSVDDKSAISKQVLATPHQTAEATVFSFLLRVIARFLHTVSIFPHAAQNKNCIRGEGPFHVFFVLLLSIFSKNMCWHLLYTRTVVAR